MAHGGGSTQADILGYDKSSKMQDAGGLQSSSSHPSSGLVGHPSLHDRDTGSLVFTTCPTSRASSVLLLLSYPEISAWSHSNERIVQPRESEIEHIVSMAFTEFFSVEGLRPKILPLMERSHHHHRQLTYCPLPKQAHEVRTTTDSVMRRSVTETCFPIHPVQFWSVGISFVDIGLVLKILVLTSLGNTSAHYRVFGRSDNICLCQR